MNIIFRINRFFNIVLIGALFVLLGSCGGGNQGVVPTKEFAWQSNVMTQDIPTWGSSVRLKLPVALEDIVLGASGGTGSYGAHQGSHAEGLNHIWLPIKNGTTINSWADGKVSKIEDMGDHGIGDGSHEYFITIEYGGGLIGKHLDAKTPLVKVGDSLKAGDPVALGWSAEFQLIDNNRTDGERTGGNFGAHVSPFDYLKPDIKAEFLQKYKDEVVEPYFKKGLEIGNNRPWEPYLTNKMFFHEDYLGTFVGEWILVSKPWNEIDPLYFDVFTIFNVTNEYGSFQKAELSDHDWDIPGNKNHTDATWSAPDGDGKAIFQLRFGKTYYAIYQVDESDGRSKLTIEWQENTYPASFTSAAAVYRVRSKVYLANDVETLVFEKKKKPK